MCVPSILLETDALIENNIKHAVIRLTNILMLILSGRYVSSVQFGARRTGKAKTFSLGFTMSCDGLILCADGTVDFWTIQVQKLNIVKAVARNSARQDIIVATVVNLCALV